MKRRREFEITDLATKVHVLRADSDAELHWWVQLFEHARKKIPPAHPIAHLPAPTENPTVSMPNTVVDTHVRVDHVMCVVHGIGVDEEALAANVRLLQESYADIMAKVFPDLDFGIELLVIHWRDALTSLDVHRKLRAVVPRSPFVEQPDANPLKHIMEYRVVDYVYYTYPRYRRHMLREVCRQLNDAVKSFRARRPDYKGGISVTGHSLGAALCYDLLSKRVHDDQTLLEAEGMRLKFDVDNLFCLGNPLGTLLSLDPSIGGTSAFDLNSLPFRVFNVFKYHDPIATRVEPLRDLRWVDVPPVMVPCWMNMGLRESTAQWFGSLWAGQRRRESDAEGSANGSASNKEREKDESGIEPASSHNAVVAADGTDVTDGGATNGGSTGDTFASGGDSRRTSLNLSTHATAGDDGATVSERDKMARGSKDGRWAAAAAAASGAASSLMEDMPERLDYALQLSSTMEEMSTSWSAIKSHAEYWGNRDAMLLMVSRMIKSTFDIADDDQLLDGDVMQRIVDRDILVRGAVADAADLSATQLAKKTTDGGRRVELEVCVAQVVERMVEEAAAMHKLVRQHPDVRLRQGGGVAGQSPVTRPSLNSEERPSSWTSYLGVGWFGSEADEKTKSK